MMTDAPRVKGQRKDYAILAGVSLLVILALGLFLRVYQIGQVPPGLHSDEAWYGLDALLVWTEGVHPIYFENNNGREPLFIYLLAAAFRVFGFGSLTMKLAAAGAGGLTILVVYAMARESFAEERPARALATALFAALALSTLYWHTHYSRLALRAITMPLFEAVTLWLFWRAMRLGRRRDALWAGLALGLSMYTYLAARLLAPLVVVLFVLRALEQKGFWMARWKCMALLSLVALAVSLPLWLYFLQNPAQFLFRVDQISLGGAQERGEMRMGFWPNLGRTLLMFTHAGDWGWADNLPGRPVFDLWGSVSFLLGVAVVIFRYRRTRYVQWLVALLVMLIPTILTNYAPTYTRSIGAVIPTAALVGVGMAQLWDWLSARWFWRGWGPLTLGVLLAGMAIFTGQATFRDYFGVWATQRAVAAVFDGDREAARIVTPQPAGSHVYVSYGEPDVYLSPLDFGLKQAYAGEVFAHGHDFDLHWYHRSCLIVPQAPAPEPLVYLLPPAGSTPDLLPYVQAAFPDGQVGPMEYAADGLPLLTPFLVPAGRSSQPLSPALSAQHTFGSALVLRGADLSATMLAPGGTLDVLLYWQVEQAVPQAYTLSVQLLGEQMNAGGNPVWGQRDEIPCQGSLPTTVWAPGSAVLTHLSVPIAADAPAGTYRLAVGLYLPADGTRLGVQDAAGADSPDNLAVLGAVQVQP